MRNIDQLNRARWLWLLLGGAAASACLFSACSGGFTSCQSNKDCGPYDGPMAGEGGGGQGGVSGHGGQSGSTGGGQGGSTSGSGGESGAGEGGAGAGGEAGVGGAPPCDGHCGGATPVCDVGTNACVECVKKDDCGEATKPACDVAKHSCVECTEGTDCTSTDKLFCDVTKDQCVACLEQRDCKQATASACNDGQCQPCTQDAECSNIAGKGVCNAGTCVQCTGTKFAACGSSMGSPLVCDSLMHTCSTNKQASAGLCQACVSDAQCSSGKICVQEQYGTPAQNVGYFCFWKEGDTADGAPPNCLTQGRPYAKTLAGAVSVDGITSNICSLRSSTCVARNEFSSKDCTKNSTADDSVCGASPGKDSKCQSAGGNTFLCTMTCGTDADCPTSFTCDTGAGTPVCSF